jgi:predicted ester cyclase
MFETKLSDIFRKYIDCLNRKNFSELGLYVDDNVYYNDKKVGLSGLCDMLEKEFYYVPDLRFDIQLLVSEGPYVASRVLFDCSPHGKFFDVNVMGRRFPFVENLFYEFQKEKIICVWWPI